MTFKFTVKVKFSLRPLVLQVNFCPTSSISIPETVREEAEAYLSMRVSVERKVNPEDQIISGFW